MDNTQDKLLFALDIGTTTIAGQLVAACGRSVARESVFNPQQRIGGDIISRLEYALQPEGALELRELMSQGVAELLSVLLQQAGTDSSSIARAVAAANSGISLLARGARVDSMLKPPYRPAESTAAMLEIAGVPVYLFPLVGGFVGGDLLAVLYGMEAPRATTLVIDVGTNAEMALFDGQRWLATSVAAGPAFEGGNIGCGMPARAGAVCGVSLDGERLKLETIAPAGGTGAYTAPRGLCGSGVAEALAVGLTSGLVGRDGTLAQANAIENNLARYLAHRDGQACLRLYRDASTDLCLTQDDIRQLQLAKGAIYAGAECLLQRAGIDPAALQRVCITGALGTSISAQVLKEIALLPEYMIKKVIFIRDGVLAGLNRFLQTPDAESEVEALRSNISLYPCPEAPLLSRRLSDHWSFNDI